MKLIFRSAFLFVVALSMMVGMTFMTACDKKTETKKTQTIKQPKTVEPSPEAEVAVEETTLSDMLAPQIQPNKAGLITLKLCPTTYQNLKVELSKDCNEAKIYDGDSLLQTISAPDCEQFVAGGNALVYFMDANFDGYVDIFIGSGESRTYSTLLTWNPVEKQFVRVGEQGNPTLQNFMLYPSKKTVFDGGSESAFADFFTCYDWKNGGLQKLNDLYVVNDPEKYIEYGVDAKYTLRDADDKVLLSTDKLSDLPAQWIGLLNDLLSVVHK